ncbi:extracellular catalytic domain type 1 short-chain-length polyhydroxyalkanoate depolymerase [Actinacidiphila bryophytorum]|uniref:Esterase, PHB depolymerase family n=1 Tax=Actinacidiphila bryophytorum TaxID=1436133 RepID=A0A9W4MJV7_9ACTN|nr:PHB depolymerase family esterase [Actinacidiphila bryophytorum]MBM9437562.1 PHB depolymerase family esterase [Actinacidiphila bryophytorum]CAG7655930.1 Esterase, PHB depolymerase family [Actinacidiphila bryophytorum]
MNSTPLPRPRGKAHRPTPLRRRVAGAVTGVLALVAACLGAVAGAEPAAAAGLTQVTSFGSNPGNLAMYEYAPAGLPAGAPVVVALHGCTQSASDYFAHSGWQKYADLWGFALVLPQTSASNNSLSCFSWFDPAKDTRGKGEAASVVSMVSHAVTQYGSDSGRVFVTGLSAGGGMTADLLADYPDVFAGGAVDSGLPAQCATSQTAASTCQYGSVNLTPAQLGDKVRASDPGYSGPWPRVAIWQGASDYTVYPVNGTELRDQWTNVWGIGQTASSTQTLPGGTTLSVYDDPSGRPAVQLYQISGMGHGLAVDPGSGTEQCGTTGSYYLDTICSSYYTARFWGLDGSTPPGGGGGTLPAPTAVTVAGTTDSTVSLSWGAVTGAASYRVYRGGTLAGSPTGTSFTDTGLTAGTAYSYTVAAVDSSGAVGAASSAVAATTTGGGGSGSGQCFTDNNYNQVAAGRAHQSGGYTYADGSDQNMGLWNLFTTHTLKETGADYYVIADGTC